VSIGTNPPRGTRDFYPEDLRQREWLFGHFRAVARAFGFEEVDAPVVEHEELFTRKAGEEIVQQLYRFELHEHRYALRPEMTPSLARMVLGRRGALRLPLRWTSIPQCWRYERMQRGRRREHYQWNMDVWGEPRVTAEAELLAALFQLLDRLGVPRGEVRVRASSRALLEDTLRAGVLRERPEAFPALCVAIDKLGKIGPDAVRELLTDPAGLVRLPRADAGFVLDWLALRGLEEAVDLAAKVGGHNPPRVHMPTGALRAIARLGPYAARALGQPPNFGEVVSAGDGVTYWASSAKASESRNSADAPAGTAISPRSVAAARFHSRTRKPGPASAASTGTPKKTARPTSRSASAGASVSP